MASFGLLSHVLPELPSAEVMMSESRSPSTTTFILSPLGDTALNVNTFLSKCEPCSARPNTDRACRVQHPLVAGIGGHRPQCFGTKA